MTTLPTLIQTRKAYGTQALTAAALGISTQTVARFEAGTRPAPYWYAYALQAIAGHHPKWRAAFVTAGAVEYLPGVYKEVFAAVAAGEKAWPTYGRYLPNNEVQTVFFFTE